jgi:hypothetical protein
LDTSSFKSGLDIAATISMAIPPPAGPFVTAGLQIFAAFLPGPPPSDANQKLMEAIQGLPALIGNEAHLSAAKDKTEAVSNGVLRVQKNWDDEKQKDYEIETIDGLIAAFDGLYLVGNETETLLSGLKDLDVTGAAGYSSGRAALSAYLDLLGAFIVAKKVYVELRSAKVALLDKARQAGGQHSRAAWHQAMGDLFLAYNDLCNTIRDYTDPKGQKYPDLWGSTTLADLAVPAPAARASDDPATARFGNGLAGKLRRQRSDLISNKTEGENSDGLPRTVETHFIDDQLLTPSRQMTVSDTWVERQVFSAMGPIVKVDFTCLKSQVDAAFPGYLQGVLDAFDSDMAQALKTYDGLLDQVGQIISDLVPQDPAEPVTVTWVDAGTEGYWALAPGPAVAWGIQFANGSNTSRILWSAWVTSPGPTHIPLLSVPCDISANALTTSRMVYRVSRATAPDHALPTGDRLPDDDSLIGIPVPDNTTAAIYDVEQDPANDRPPVPQAPPVAVVASPAPAADGSVARRYSFTWDSNGRPSPVASPATAPLVLNPGDRLMVSVVREDLVPRFLVRRDGEDHPAPVTGAPVLSTSDGDVWFWTAS